MTDLLQFYPTPPALVHKLVAPSVQGEHAWNRRISGVILDPSAAREPIDHREPFYSTFFRIRVYKKGTVH